MPRRSPPRLGLAILAAALAGGLLAGCASSGGGGAGSAVPAPSTSLAPPVTPTTTKPPAAVGTVTVVGRVQAGVEAGCLLLADEAGGGSWLLLGGDRDVIKAGARVRVTGTEARGVATICQQGRPLQVSSAEPA